MMTFESILRMRQENLKQALEQHLCEQGYTVVNRPGFLYAKGDVPVLLVAHLDTVHREPPRIICYSPDRRYMMSPQGIGGDDRAGVWMILQIIQTKRCHVLFCEDEETGGNGARAFTHSKITADVCYIVEMDRRGSNDAVFYDCDNPEFTDFVCSFGFSEASGSFSDISVVAPYLKKAAVNISAGYYCEHRQHEMIDCAAMQDNIERIKKMLAVDTQSFPYMQRRFSFQQCSLFDRETFISYADYGYQKKLLAALPDSVCLLMNGSAIEPSYSYRMDSDGNVYSYVKELEAAVLLENTFVCDERGKPIEFPYAEAAWVSVISMEAALEQLGIA